MNLFNYFSAIFIAIGVLSLGRALYGDGAVPNTAPTPTPTYVLNTWTMEKLYTFDTILGSKGSDINQLNDPEGIYVGPDDRLYIADTLNNRILVWTADGKPLKSIGTLGTAAIWRNPPQFDHPMYVMPIEGGQMYVADTYNQRIVMLDSEGLVLLSWGREGNRKRQFNMPRVVAKDHYGNIWVLDSQNNRVQNFTNTGKFNFMWGSYGSQHGFLNNPLGMALNFIDQGIVADTGNFRIQVFNDKSPSSYDQSAPVTTDTQPATEAPTPIITPEIPVTVEGWYGDGPAQFKEPGGVSMTKTGWIAVTDGSTGRVIFLNNRFEFRGQWRASDENMNLPNPPHPRGIGCDSQNRLYVTDIANNCIIRLKPIVTAREAQALPADTPTPTPIPTPTPDQGQDTPYGGIGFPIR
jgi:hypothetical protein